MELTPEWFLWYGLRLGLTYDQTLDLPMGELRDLISVEQIKYEGARLRESDEDFFSLLNRR